MKSLIASQTLFTLAMQFLDLCILVNVFDRSHSVDFTILVFICQIVAPLFSLVVITPLMRRHGCSALTMISLALSIVALVTLAIALHNEEVRTVPILGVVFFLAFSNAIYRPLIQGAIPILSSNCMHDIVRVSIWKNIATVIAKPLVPLFGLIVIPLDWILIGVALIIIISIALFRPPMETRAKIADPGLNLSLFSPIMFKVIPIATLLASVVRMGLHQDVGKISLHLGITFSSFTFGVLLGLWNRTLRRLSLLIGLIGVLFAFSGFQSLPFFVTLVAGVLFSVVDISLNSEIARIVDYVSRVRAFTALMVASAIVPAVILALTNVLAKRIEGDWFDWGLSLLAIAVTVVQIKRILPEGFFMARV
ncbi:MAG: hypothetical protein HYW48_01325 [Deltaproteobacteria bacterium]|nr:hypothetical protein [Deltaproteobacteria bacterium]